MNRSLLCLLVISTFGFARPLQSQQVPVSAKTEHTGTYSLVSIDGNKLPFAPPHEGGTPPEIRSSTFTLNADGSFALTMTYGLPSGETFSRDFSGTYTHDGSAFTFEWKGAGTTSAIMEGNTLTMDNEGVLYAYRK